LAVLATTFAAAQDAGDAGTDGAADALATNLEAGPAQGPENRATGRQLAAEANYLLLDVGGSEAVERAAALAIEGWRRDPTPLAYQAAMISLAELPVARVEHGAPISALAFSPDGARLATGSEDGAVHLSDARTGQQLARIKHVGAISAVAFSRRENASSPEARTVPRASLMPQREKRSRSSGSLAPSAPWLSVRMAGDWPSAAGMARRGSSAPQQAKRLP
jgi:hypothetical protein